MSAFLHVLDSYTSPCIHCLEHPGNHFQSGLPLFYVKTWCSTWMRTCGCGGRHLCIKWQVSSAIPPTQHNSLVSHSHFETNPHSVGDIKSYLRPHLHSLSIFKTTVTKQRRVPYGIVDCPTMPQGLVVLRFVRDRERRSTTEKKPYWRQKKKKWKKA